jgi:hypothetical protein
MRTNLIIEVVPHGGMLIASGQRPRWSATATAAGAPVPDPTLRQGLNPEPARWAISSPVLRLIETHQHAAPLSKPPAAAVIAYDGAPTGVPGT